MRHGIESIPSPSVADPERFDADPDPTFQADADPEPDPDPNFVKLGREKLVSSTS